MTFDPYNVRRYVIESRGQGDPGAVLVAARDYDQLLAMVKSQEVLIQELEASRWLWREANRARELEVHELRQTEKIYESIVKILDDAGVPRLGPPTDHKTRPYRTTCKRVGMVIAELARLKEERK